MSEERKPFTVSDRRHFTAEGEARQTEPEDAQKPPADVQREAEHPTGSPADARPPGAAPPTSVDFASFLVSLAAQASMMMGPGSEPAGPADLEGARSIISILEMLQDKTDGRRTSEEDRLLDGLLYELRMAYVSRSRTGAA